MSCDQLANYFRKTAIPLQRTKHIFVGNACPASMSTNIDDCGATLMGSDSSKTNKFARKGWKYAARDTFRNLHSTTRKRSNRSTRMFLAGSSRSSKVDRSNIGLSGPATITPRESMAVWPVRARVKILGRSIRLPCRRSISRLRKLRKVAERFVCRRCKSRMWAG